MKTSLLKHAFILLLTGAALMLGGCSTMHTATHKQELKVKTKMSETVFLEPVGPSQQTVYVKLRNTSDKELDDLEPRIKAALISRGYTIVNDPADAWFMLQANVLHVGQTDDDTVNSMVDAGFGGAVAGGFLGAATTGRGRGMVAGALLGAAAGMIADALVDDVYFSIVTDLQIRERPLAGETITQTQTYREAQGGTVTKQRIEGAQMEWKTYNTRVVSSANKMNLTYDEAKEPLTEGLVRAIGGIF